LQGRRDLLECTISFDKPQIPTYFWRSYVLWFLGGGPFQMSSNSAQALEYDDYRAAVEASESLKRELEQVERQLAVNLGFQHRNIRRRLVTLDRCNQLVEGELVASWHELYAQYLEWGSVGDPPRTTDDSEKKAAEAAFVVLLA
jgi:hypothetical protein